MSLTQNQRIAKVSTSMGDGVFALYRMAGNESVSRLFEYDLELLSENGSVDLQALLGTTVTVELMLEDGSGRPFHGIVTRVSQLGMINDLYAYRFLIRPRLWLLTRAANCRVLSPTAGGGAAEAAPSTVPDIIKAVLDEHGCTDYVMEFQETYQPRDFCVQYRETDFSFISRLMEDEGIYYYFRHTTSSHTLVLCDNMSSHPAFAGGTVKFYPPANQAARDEEHLHEWILGRQIQAGAYALNDYNFETPGADLKARSTLAGDHSAGDKEIYDYPGSYTAVADGERFARLEMERMRAEHEQITAQGNVRRLAVGQKFQLSGLPRSDQAREYLVLSSRFVIQSNEFGAGGQGGEVFQSAYTLLPSQYVYRAPRLLSAPVIHGLQTAVVVGGQDDEIHTDQYGRVKIQFHWDRLGQKNENSSCWVRVAHIWAGKNWGGVFLPRVGQEVIVDFLDGNPDRPIVVGRVYNQDNMPPYALDANKTQSGIKTRSTPDGTAENFNEIRFEDKKNEEELYIHAEKDFKRVVENNDTQKIGFDKKDPGDQTIDIYNHRTVTLDQGNDKLTIKTGNRTVNLEQGNDELTLSSGNLTVKLDAGSISEEAAQSIELKVGSSSVKIDQSGVTIKGMTVKIQADTQAELKGLQTTVSGDGMLTVRGGLVQIN